LPGAGYVDMTGAFCMGIITSCLSYFCEYMIRKYLKYIDTYASLGVNGIGGICGMLLTSLFAQSNVGGVNGVFYGSTKLLLPQFCGAIGTAIWCTVMTYILFWPINKLFILKIPPDLERKGQDFNNVGTSMSEHGLQTNSMKVPTSLRQTIQKNISDFRNGVNLSDHSVTITLGTGKIFAES
jgi:Amt family ammonium transporter